MHDRYVNTTSENCFFRELKFTKLFEFGAMEDSGSGVTSAEQQGGDVHGDSLRAHLGRATSKAMKEELHDVQVSADVKTKAAVKGGGAAGYITDCGDWGALTSSEDEVEEMVSASSTLSQAQRKVFLTFSFQFPYFPFQVQFNTTDSVDSPSATNKLRRLLIPSSKTPTVTRSLTSTPEGTRLQAQELGVDSLGNTLR